MKVFKRGLATFLTALLLIPSKPVMAANVLPSVPASTETAEEKTVDEKLPDSKEESKETEAKETEISKEDEVKETETSGTEETAEATTEASELETGAFEEESQTENETPGSDSTEGSDSTGDADDKQDFIGTGETDSEEYPPADKIVNVTENLWNSASNFFDVKELAEEEVIATLSNATRTLGNEVRFNTGNCEFCVVDRDDFDSGFGDAYFEEDGSYTINIPEENPFFPYEIQFTYDGKTSSQWFMSPDDSVAVGGHKFYVSAYFDNTAVTQMSLEVAGDIVTVYPKKKEFTDGDGAATMSLLPLKEKYFNTLDLTNYTPVELTKVSVKYMFGSEPLEDTDRVMWANGWDGDDYTISQPGDMINLSYDTYDGYSHWQMIVGDANQLHADNTRYLVSLNIQESKDWLVSTVYKQSDDGKRDKLSVSSSKYYDYKNDWEKDRRLNITVPADELNGNPDTYISLAVNESVFPSQTALYNSLKVYRGETIAADAEITDQILAKDMTVKDSGYLISGDSWITLATYDSAGNVTGCLPIKVRLNRISNSLSPYGLYDMVNGQWESVDSRYDYTSENSGNSTVPHFRKRNYTCFLQKGYALDKEYYLKMRYSKSGITDPSAVTAAYVGQYSSIAQATNAGAADIKDSLFDPNYGGGYKANYSTGVYITVFVGTDGSEKQEIYQYHLKTAEEKEGEPILNDSTDVRFTGLKDANGNSVAPCYPVNVQNDTYGDYSYITLLVEKNVDLTNLAPEFQISMPGINLYTDSSLVESGKSYRDFSQGPVHYTAGSESKKEQQNYWLQVVKKEDGAGGLYINSLKNPEAHTQIKDGIIYSTREMVMDGRYDYQHDILLINTGTADIPSLKAELVSEQVELDPYWTLKGDHVLPGFDSLYNIENYGQLQNFAKLRIKPKDGVERANISGTLTISSGTNVLMVLTLTGTIGDPYITTTEIPPAVKYVPYAVMIQNNNKYDFNRVQYYLEEGTLPGGMKIYPNGELYGIPTESGTFTFTVRMENSYEKFKPSEQTLTLTVKENTNLNVYNESDAGYTIAEHIGTEVGAGSRDYLLRNMNDQLYVSTGEFGDFIDLWLNGEKLVDGVDYIKESGSTRMTIKSQTFTSKTRKGLNTLAAEFRVGGKRENELKRTAQNFRIGGSSSTGGTTGGSSGGSGGGSRRSGSSSSSLISYSSKKGYVHAQTGIITGQGTGYSRWQQDEKGWKLVYADGTVASGHTITLDDTNTVEQILWEKINGAWYAFDLNGYLKSGWVFDYQLNSWYNVSVEKGMQSGWYTDAQDKHTYYLDPQGGNLTTGWKPIDNKWYYFNAAALSRTWELDKETGNWYYNIRSKSKPFGAMYENEKTPDGYYVGADGVWDGKEK